MATCVEGATRAVLASLYASGGFSILLRLPGLPTSGNDADQLGLGSPRFDDVPVGPATWRKAGKSTELLLAAQGVSELMGSRAFASAESLFQSAAGVIVDGVLYSIRDSEAYMVAGSACAYRLGVQGPLWA